VEVGAELQADKASMSPKAEKAKVRLSMIVIPWFWDYDDHHINTDYNDRHNSF